jgi:hypothetical protein
MVSQGTGTQQKTVVPRPCTMKDFCIWKGRNGGGPYKFVSCLLGHVNIRYLQNTNETKSRLVLMW